MYKNYFKIGFGGCGCAFVDTFEEHVYRLFRSYLLEEYKKLAKLSKLFSEDYRLEMKANLDRLKELIFEEKLDRDNLGNIKKHLDEWGKKLNDVKGGMKRSYEKTPVVKIEGIIEELKVGLRRIKEEYGVWLEALTVDSYSSSEKEDTERYLYNKFLDDTRQIRISEFEMDILDADGFNHHPELQMLPLSLQYVRNEVYTNLNSEIKKVNKKASRGHFFFLGLGGGTGTGVISPLAQEFSEGARSYYTLGALGGKDDNDYLNSQQPWFRRCFNMLLALNDLIVTAKLDGLLLVDNEILMKNLEKKLKKRARIEISNNSNDESLKEKLKLFLKDEFDIDEWVEDANIVISSQSIEFTKDDDFAEIQIFPKSQEAKVKISDGTICTLEVSEKEAEGKVIGTILLGKSNEKMVDEELIKKIFLAFGHTAFDQKNLDWSQLGGAMDKSYKMKKKPILVPCYASGDDGTASLIRKALKKGKLAECVHEKADRVFVYLRSSDTTAPESIKNELKIFSGDIEFIELTDDSKHLKEKLQDKKVKVIVIKVKRWVEPKKNEVLIILRNPDICKSLEKRLTIAKNFVYLLHEFIGYIDKAKEPLIAKKVENIIQTKSDFFKNDYLGNVDKEIPIDGIEKYLFTWGSDNISPTGQEQRNIKEYLSREFKSDWMQADINIENDGVVITKALNDKAIITINSETTGDVQFKEEKRKLRVEKGRIYEKVEDRIKKILEEASSFLLPVKQEKIYKRMKDVVERLFDGGAVDINAAIKKLQKGDWPIFEASVFEIKQALASSAEINLTTMLTSKVISDALGPETAEEIFSNEYQPKTLKDLNDSNFVEGSDFDDYILTDKGEKHLSALGLNIPLDKINKGIDNKLDRLFETVSKEDFLDYSKESIKNSEGAMINFPKLLILSLLYTKWEPLFSLDEKDGDQDKDEDEIKRYLTARKDPSLTVTGDSIFRRGEDGTGEILNISGGASGQIGILIDKDEENDIKKIHVGSFKEEVNVPETLIGELDNGEINGLWQALNNTPPLPPQYEVVKEERGYSIKDSIKGGVNNNFYIYRRDSNLLRVYEDRIADLNLRVRKSGRNKWKVYRRRE